MVLMTIRWKLLPDFNSKIADIDTISMMKCITFQLQIDRGEKIRNYDKQLQLTDTIQMNSYRDCRKGEQIFTQINQFGSPAHCQQHNFLSYRRGTQI